MQLAGILKDEFERRKFRLENLISPKYEPWEIEARAYIQAYIRIKLNMNYNQTIEQYFIAGIQWQKENQKNEG